MSVVTQVITESSASGAQVIDGSLRFNGAGKTYLQRTVPNITTFTLSFWYKTSLINRDELFDTASSTGFYLYRDDQIKINDNSSNLFTSHGYYRDPSAFYHVVFNYNGTTANLWVNGKLDKSAAISTQLYSGTAMISSSHATDTADYNLSQYYVIDAMALGPGYFGYTDPLTNTWRPKQFKAEGTTVNNGTTWSSLVTTDSGTFTGGYAAAKAFNADITDWAAPANGGADKWLGVTTANPFGIKCELVEIKFWATKLEINEEVVYELAAGGDTVQTYYISNFDTFKIYGKADGSKAALYYIKIDGVLMLDSTTQNLSYGTNGSYLPLDGSELVGHDQSGNGNHWAPTNFGGSFSLDKATGALPILNTVSGGNVATAGVRTDANAANLVLALPLCGIKSDFSNKVNSSTTEKVMTNSGATASGYISNYYGESFEFDGSNDTLHTTSNSSDFSFGSDDFTIEAWVDSDSSASRSIVSLWAYGSNKRSWNLYINSSQQVVLITSTAGSNQSDVVGPTSNTALPANKWTHVAVTKQSNTYRCFIDGVLKESNSVTETLYNNTSDEVHIGSTDGATEYFDGHIQDVRIYKGVAKYTGDFKVGSISPDIELDSPSGVSGSSKLAKITEGAVSFDGTGDYLSGFGGSAILPTSTGTAFVVDCFWHSNGNSSQKGIWEQHSSGSGRTAYFVNGTNAYLIAEGNTVGQFAYGDNIWYFTRIIYDGSGNIHHYVDGNLIASGTQTSGVDNTGFQIGAYATDCFSGFISNFRIVVGSNSLSGTDVPTAPLTNITNTSLLCCQSNNSANAYTASPGAITVNGDATATNFNPFDTDINTVLGKPSNLVTFNPLDTSLGSTQLLNGNLDMISNGSWNTSHARGTVALTSGKWYWECTAMNSVSHAQFGFATRTANLKETYSGGQSQNWTFYWNNGREVIDPAASSATYFGTGTMQLYQGDTMSCALDMDNGTWQFFRLGRPGAIKRLEDTDDASTSSITELYPFSGVHSMNLSHNFGQKPFKYPPPEGFQPVCLAGLDAPEILRPDQYVGVTTFTGTGNGNGNQEVTFPFKPDLVITKQRSGTASSGVYDSVRGTNNKLYTNAITVANTNADAGPASWDYRGLTLDDTGDDIVYNGAAGVAWAWKAGGNKGTWNIDGVAYGSAAAAGLDGGNTSPSGASVGTKQGFSIIKYTGNDTAGNTIAHGLSAAPDFVIIKNYTQTYAGGGPWVVGHKSMQSGAWTHWLQLDDDAAEADNSGMFNDTAPSSSVVTFGGSWYTNESIETYIMYCWHNVPGLQKFGSYTGTNSTDGPFVELGFRPALLIIKSNSAASTNWRIIDNGRSKHNTGANDSTSAGGPWLKLNTNGAEADERPVDFLANGFKVQGAWGGDINYDSGTPTYIYAAWAEAPINNLYGGQSNAR